MSSPVRWHMSVVIPARNEEVLLPECLRSIAAARRALPEGVSSDVVLVSDGSSDRTEEIGRQMLEGSGCVLTAQVGNVGAARALGAGTALRRCSGTMTRCWLANTDADCSVPETWLLQQLQAAQGGCCAIAGIVDVDCFEEHLAVVESRFRSTYVLHPDGTHPHVHGANLGIRADTYLAVGGWNPLPTAEDHDLWARIKLHSRLHRSDAALRVVTSGRRIGRAPAGFAAALARHNEPRKGEIAA